MLLDITRLGDADELETDVCVVGAGPTGIALAHELNGLRRQTVLIESGNLTPSTDLERLNHGQSVGAPGVGLLDGRARALGGTARRWAGQCLPLSREELVARPWVEESGWPLSPSALLPYVRRAEEFFEVGGEPYDERVWLPFGLAPFDLDREKLVHMATVYTPQPDLGARFAGPFKRSRNLRVLLRATATRLEIGENGRAVESVLLTGPGGASARVRARQFVLCAGAIENPRLLLVSGGLGNDRDLVGRYLQDHPNAHVGIVQTDDPGALLDRYSLLYRDPLRYFAKLAIAPGLQERERLLTGIANLVFDFGADSGIEAAKRLYRAARARRLPRGAGRDLRRAVSDAPALARAYRRFRRGLSPDATPERIVVQVHVEQAPDRESRVGLGDELDRYGVPVPKVDWRIGDQDVRTARVLAETVASELARIGRGEVHIDDWLRDTDAARGFSGAYHHLGTTRMADDPGRGVVDRDCAVHGLFNLYCCGGSVFPAGGVANPTLEMVALAIRLADHLAEKPA